MIIENAKWCAVNTTTGKTDTLIATINGVSLSVPKDEGNRHYAEVMKWVAEGNTIEEAD